MTECDICYCPEDALVFCCDKSCTSKICIDCISQYIDHCASEHALPKCPNEDCISYVIVSNIRALHGQKKEVKEKKERKKKDSAGIIDSTKDDSPAGIIDSTKDDSPVILLDDSSDCPVDGPSGPIEHLTNKFKMVSHTTRIDDIIDKYTELLRSYFESSYKNILDSKLLVKDAIHKIRESRSKYLDANYPASINLVINVALTKKLRKVQASRIEEKSDRKRPKSDRKRPKRICMTYSCDGVLNSDLTCLKCLSQFCKKCEILVGSGSSHECTAENMESVSFIKSMIACPNCKLAIEKSDGCNHMTCASCKTSFEYSSMEESKHGSFNKEVKIVKKKRLSQLYESLSEEIINLLRTFEDLEPDYVENSEVLGSEKTTKTLVKKKNIADHFEKFIIDNINKKQYFIYRSQLDQFCLKGSVTTDIIEDIIKKVLL
jgi:hypothetical protein